MAKDNHVLHNQPEICLECFHCLKYIPGFLQISWLSFSKHHFNKLTNSFTANQYEEPKFDSPVIYLLPSKTLKHIRFPLFISTLRTLHLLRARSSVFISLWECISPQKSSTNKPSWNHTEEVCFRFEQPISRQAPGMSNAPSYINTSEEMGLGSNQPSEAGKTGLPYINRT